MTGVYGNGITHPEIVAGCMTLCLYPKHLRIMIGRKQDAISIHLFIFHEYLREVDFNAQGET